MPYQLHDVQDCSVTVCYHVDDGGITDLPNRLLFSDRLQKAMDDMEKVRRYGALMLLDLDSFKDINDRLGHDMGDKLLR